MRSAACLHAYRICPVACLHAQAHLRYACLSGQHAPCDHAIMHMQAPLASRVSCIIPFMSFDNVEAAVVMAGVLRGMKAKLTLPPDEKNGRNIGGLDMRIEVIVSPGLPCFHVPSACMSALQLLCRPALLHPGHAFL